MAALPEIRINRDADIRREAIAEDHHCVIVDDFLQNPHALVEFATRYAGKFSVPDSNYPGLCLRVRDSSMADVYRFVRFRMSKHFPFLRSRLKMWTVMSLATTQPDELSTFQRLCHTDHDLGPEHKTYAALVYLFENEHLGGTGFYRWRELASVNKARAIEAENPGQGLEFLQEHFPTYRKSACYMTGSNEIAESLCTIPARFNRMVFYAGSDPHSALITAPELLSSDPQKGRLTLNVFAGVLPR